MSTRNDPILADEEFFVYCKITLSCVILRQFPIVELSQK